MNEYTEEQLKELTLKMIECNVKKEQHKHSAYLYNKYDKMTGLPQIILSAILSSTTMTQIADTEEIDRGFIYFNAIASLSLVTLTSITRYFEFGKLKEAHKKSSIAFGKLERLIQLEKIKSSKQQFDIFFETIMNEYNNVKESAPLIPSYFSCKFETCLNNILDENKSLNSR